MTEKFIPTHAISHMDLDGMCAGVLIRKCFGISVKYCGYTSLDRIYTKMMETEGSRVILTDLSAVTDCILIIIDTISPASVAESTVISVS